MRCSPQRVLDSPQSPPPPSTFAALPFFAKSCSNGHVLAGFPVGPEIPAGIDGRVTTRQFVLKSYELTVQFVTPDGTLRNKNLELTTLFGGIAEEREPTVRLMPGSVDDFALSLAVDVAKTRWAAATPAPGSAL